MTNEEKERRIAAALATPAGREALAAPLCGGQPKFFKKAENISFSIKVRENEND